MMYRGDPWKVPWYAVEDAVEGFSAGGATVCHGMSRKRTIMCIEDSHDDFRHFSKNPSTEFLRHRRTTCLTLPFARMSMTPLFRPPHPPRGGSNPLL